MVQSDPLIEFAAALRAVRDAAGEVPAAELARRAGIDETVLAAALSGAMLPSLGVTMAIVAACGATPAGWEAKWREVATAHLNGPTPEPAPIAPPAPAAPAPPPRPSAAPSIGRPPAPNAPPTPAYPAGPPTPPAPPRTPPTQPSAPPDAVRPSPPTPPPAPPTTPPSPPSAPPVTPTASTEPPAPARPATETPPVTSPSAETTIAPLHRPQQREPATPRADAPAPARSTPTEPTDPTPAPPLRPEPEPEAQPTSTASSEQATISPLHQPERPEPEPEPATTPAGTPEPTPPAADRAAARTQAQPAAPASAPPETTDAPPPRLPRPEPTQPNPNPAVHPRAAPDPALTVQPPVVERPLAQRQPAPTPAASASTSAAPTPAAAPPVPSWEGPDRAVLAPLEGDDPRTVGGYLLRARLGSGGMGRVYLSYTPGGRPIAVKVIRAEFADDPEFRRRFRQEVAAAQRVQGLYTAPVIDTDADAAQPWLATAYVPGPSLHDAVHRHGPLPAETVLVLMAGVAEALQSVHRAGVVHRDLKPSNVILAADGPRVIDFGIARAADATPLTRTGTSIGTPAFMAPEQARGLPSKPATDVFALGSLATYAATGMSAFGEGTDSSVLYRVVHQEPELAAVPARLLPVLHRCLDKDPDRRPTPREVIDLCRAASEGTRLQVGEGWLPQTLVAEVTRRVNEQPPRAPEDPTVRRRRNRRALIAAVTVLVVAAAGTGLAIGLRSNDDDSSPAAKSHTQSPNPSTAGTPAAPGQATPTRTPSAERTGTPTGSAASTASGPPSIAPRPGESATAVATAGGVAEGGVLFERQLDVPNGYCVGLGYSSTWRGSCSPSAGIMYFYGDGNYIQGQEMVLLDPGQPSDFRTCLGETRYANNNQLPFTYLKVGSVICTKDFANGLVGTIRVNEIPSNSGPSQYWKISMTVWRGPRR
ncbi:protein kinase domain-containing protein [Embleya sp. NPDC001921]